MGVSYIENKDMEKALYCTTTMQAFGPIFYAEDDVEDFIEWLKPRDARVLTQKELDTEYYKWKGQTTQREL